MSKPLESTLSFIDTLMAAISHKADVLTLGSDGPVRPTICRRSLPVAAGRPKPPLVIQKKDGGFLFESRH